MQKVEAQTADSAQSTKSSIKVESCLVQCSSNSDDNHDNRESDPQSNNNFYHTSDYTCCKDNTMTSGSA